jgi:cytochrome c oxidase subunit 4
MASDHAHAATSDHAADVHHDPAEIDKHVRVYIIVFVALMALTLITVAVSYLDVSTPVAIAIALFIATIKGSLVACYFMHLISEKKLIYAVLAITVIKFVALMILPVLTHSNGFWIPEEHPVPAATAPSPHQ